MYKLLIAEDEPLERKALKIILEREFYNIDIVEDAKNGDDAVNNAKLYKPDIILMDIKMPEKTGIDAQREIIKFLPNVKTILITAYGDFNYAQKAIKFGVFDYLLKPVKPSDLKSSIEKSIKAIEKIQSTKTANFSNNNLPEDMLKTVLNYIHSNYNHQITLNDVAKFVHLNTQYFSRYFKNKTGTTFTQYITNIRIENAKKLLINTNMSISQIALQVGYSDPAYFSKVFVKCEQQSPYKYKQNHTK